MKKAVVAVLFFLLIGDPPLGIAYDTVTHREIAERSADPSVSSVDRVLKDELRFLRGIEEVLPGRSEPRPRTIQQLIGDGALFEDSLDTRVLNHFHNPLLDPWDEAGLRALPLLGFGLIRGQSSVLWQQNPAQDSSLVFTPIPILSGGGNWSWQDARRHYLNALTRPRLEDRDTEEGRDRAFADTFEALGHLTHLIQDASVPAHVRNDPHPFFRRDWYEDWVEQTRQGSAPKFRALLNAEPSRPTFSIFTPTGNARAPLPIARLLDTDAFLGRDPDVLTQQNIGIAEYTNGNFLSRGTRFRTFALPQPTSLDVGPVIEVEPGKFRRYFTKSREGATITHFATEGMLFDSVVAVRGAPLPTSGWILDKLVHEDYARNLLPRAVGYSAALLDYFFRGKLDVDLVPADPDDASVVRLSGTNASSEALGGGTLTLYADDPTTGLRSAATGLDLGLTVTADPGASVESARFQVPENSERFVAVYKGTLGLEKPEGTFPGGVIAKVVGGVRVEEVFSDGINWKLRTPKGVFPLKKEGNLPLTAAEFEGVRWGDGDNLLVTRTPFGMDQPNRFVVYEIQRQAGSAEVVTVSTPEGPAVPLTVRNEAVFPGGGIDLGTTVTFVSSIQYSQRIAEYVHKAVGTTDPQGNCAIDHRELGPISVRTVASGGPTFSGSFQVRLDLAREGTFGTLSEPYIWFLQEVAATADARLLGLVVVFLTSPEGSPVSVPFIGLNRDTGAEEIVGQQTFSPSFPPGVNILVWALVDLQTGTVVASTATSNISLASQTGGEGFPDVYQHFVNTCTGFEQWARVSPVPVSSDFPIDQLTNVSVGGGILAHTVLGWVKDELNTLTFNGQRLFDFQLGTVFGSGRSLIECVGLPAGGVTCNGIEQSGSQGVLVKMADNLQDARRSRPAPGSERLALIASTGFGARDTVLAWDPGKGARVLLALPGLGENVHVLGPVTGNATLVAPLDGWRGSFHIVSLEGSESPAFFSNDNFNFFTLLNPRFLYNADDLKFYRRRPPLQASVLPLKLADLPDGSNPIGDYHAIRLP